MRESRLKYWGAHPKPSKKKAKVPGLVRARAHGRELAAALRSWERLEKVRVLKDSKMLALFRPGALGSLDAKLAKLRHGYLWPHLPYRALQAHQRSAFEVTKSHV